MGETSKCVNILSNTEEQTLVMRQKIRFRYALPKFHPNPFCYNPDYYRDCYSFAVEQGAEHPNICSYGIKLP